MNALGWFSSVWAVTAAVITNVVLLRWTLRARKHRWYAAGAVPVVGPPVTVIRPLRGPDSDALENHRSLVEQRYHPLEVVFATGVDDTGSFAANAVCSTGSARARILPVDSVKEGLSDKGRKMIAAWATTHDPFVAFSDSDLRIQPDAIGRCMRQFDDPSVGAVFAHCIVVGEGFLGHLSMLTIAADAYAFLVGTAQSNCALFLEGGLMVLRRSAIEKSGGIAQVANAIGDDTRLGRSLRESGHKLRLADFVLIHRNDRERPSAWAARYRRWMMCHRAEATTGFYAEVLLNPTAIPLLMALVAPLGSRALILCVLAASAVSRVLIARSMDLLLLRRHGVRLGWCVVCRPLADVLHFVFCVSVLVAPWVCWRGIKYWVSGNGDILASAEEESSAVMQATPAVDT